MISKQAKSKIANLLEVKTFIIINYCLAAIIVFNAERKLEIQDQFGVCARGGIIKQRSMNLY